MEGIQDEPSENFCSYVFVRGRNVYYPDDGHEAHREYDAHEPVIEYAVSGSVARFVKRTVPTFSFPDRPPVPPW